MNKQDNYIENTEIQHTVSQSELIEPLGTTVEKSILIPESEFHKYQYLVSENEIITRIEIIGGDAQSFLPINDIGQMPQSGDSSLSPEVAPHSSE